MPRPDLDGSPQDTREDIESEATQRGFTLEPVYAGRPPPSRRSCWTRKKTPALGSLPHERQQRLRTHSRRHLLQAQLFPRSPQPVDP